MMEPPEFELWRVTDLYHRNLLKVQLRIHYKATKHVPVTETKTPTSANSDGHSFKISTDNGSRKTGAEAESNTALRAPMSCTAAT